MQDGAADDAGECLPGLVVDGLSNFDYEGGILGQLAVCCDQVQGLAHCLRNQQPIEWVSVQEGQFSYLCGVTRGDGKFYEAAGFHFCDEPPQVSIQLT